MAKKLQKPLACDRMISDTLENEIDKNLILSRMLKIMELNKLPPEYTMELNEILNKQKLLLIKFSSQEEINQILAYKMQIITMN